MSKNLRAESNTQTYITGITALNILWPDRPAADWHTLGLANVFAWSWAGQQLMSTEHLLGDQDLYEATSILRCYAPETPEGMLAASYQRAVFDLLYSSAIKRKPVGNIQAADIDDAVDFGLVIRWIESLDPLPAEVRNKMLAWLRADC